MWIAAFSFWLATSIAWSIMIVSASSCLVHMWLTFLSVLLVVTPSRVDRPYATVLCDNRVFLEEGIESNYLLFRIHWGTPLDTFWLVRVLSLHLYYVRPVLLLWRSLVVCFNDVAVLHWSNTKWTVIYLEMQLVMYILAIKAADNSRYVLKLSFLLALGQASMIRTLPSSWSWAFWSYSL